MKLVDASKTDNILIVAAEASSCMYAKMFIKKWQEKRPESHFFGIGDKEMASEGMNCLGLAEELAVVGLQEVLSHWPDIKKTFLNIVDQTKQDKPRFALLIDYPGFNLRLAKKLTELGVPVVYYISPQLWAWKKGRVKQVKKYVDDMLVVFPFEVDFYKEHDVLAHFVGHPLVELVDQELRSVGSSSGKPKPVLGLMPGSRKSEIKHNFLDQVAAARMLAKDHEIAVRVLVAPTLEVDDLKKLSSTPWTDIDFIKTKPTQMIHDCDLILTASGTATLQVALCEKPMVVMYKMNSFTAFFAKLLVRSVNYFCIVNLIAQKQVVPELFQEDAHPKNLRDHLEKILVEFDYRSKMIENLKATKHLLGKGGAIDNLVHYLEKKYI